MSATLAPAPIRVSTGGKAPVSASIEAVKAMPIETLRAELKRRRSLSASQREASQLESIERDAASSLRSLSGSAA